VKRPSVGGIVRLAIAAGLTALVFWKSDPARIWDVASRARLAPLLVAVLLVIVDRALMAYRWLVLLRPLPASRRPPFTEVMRVFFVSTFVGTFLPASVGGDAVRAFALAKLDVPAADSVASVLMDRVLGVLSLLLMALASLFVVRNLAANALVQLSLLVTAAGCLFMALLVFSDRAAALVRRAIQAIPLARGRRVGHALLESIQRYSTHHGALANVLVGSVGVQVLRVVQAYFLGRALGIPTSLVLYFAFIPLILLVMLLPVTINGLGTSQAAFVWFFGTAGVGRAEAFALSVLFVALGIVGNLPGGLLYVWRGVGAAPAQPSGPVGP
jgi:uncharacterized protein (TIRG00374 family)